MTPFRSRTLAALAALGIAVACYFGLPKVRYESAKILSDVRIPFSSTHWRGRDMSRIVNLADRRYNFIGDSVVRQYVSDLGESLLFLVVDAIDFHHPRGCFDSSGFVVHALEDVPLRAGNKTWRAQAYFMEKGSQGTLVVYWICIDGKIADWASQRFEQLAHSLFGKKQAGFMVRLDVPARRDSVDSAVSTAVSFVREIGAGLAADDSAYLFGGKTG